jgi:argininosuccinate synthase
VPAKTSKYSVNRGLWGATIGGQETHASDGVLPEDAYLLTAAPSRRPAEPQRVRIDFDRGVPVRLDGSPLDPVALIERLGAAAGRHGVGRGMHVGDTIVGIKGRVAFEAPAAVTLIAAHRELEKLVLSRQQLFWKATLGDLYGGMLHEARFFDPLMRDLEAFLGSSQQRVSGSATVRLFQGQATVEGAASRYSLMDRNVAVYGEESSMWSGDEAAAFSKIYGLADVLVHRKGDAHAALG